MKEDPARNPRPGPAARLTPEWRAYADVWAVSPTLQTSPLRLPDGTHVRVIDVLKAQPGGDE